MRKIIRILKSSEFRVLSGCVVASVIIVALLNLAGKRVDKLALDPPMKAEQDSPASNAPQFLQGGKIEPDWFEALHNEVKGRHIGFTVYDFPLVNGEHNWTAAAYEIGYYLDSGCKQFGAVPIWFTQGHKTPAGAAHELYRLLKRDPNLLPVDCSDVLDSAEAIAKFRDPREWRSR